MTADLSTASAAPGDLEFVRRFGDTLDIEGGTDELGTPSQAAVAGRSGTDTPHRPSRAEQLVEVREALRDLERPRD